MADHDYQKPPYEDNICPDCGEPLTSEDEFQVRAEMICEALDGAAPDEYVVLLIKFLAVWLAQYEPKSRARARKDMLRFLDKETRDRVIQQCDA